AAVNSCVQSHGLILPDDTTWQRAVQGYISLWYQGNPPTTPDKPRISATWLAQVLDATVLPANWCALIAVFWLSGARRDTNPTFACDSFTFVPASHTLLIDLNKKKRGERSHVAKLITRPLDRVTYAFLERHLPDAFHSSDSLQAPATALNNLTDEVGIIAIRQHFIRAGLTVDTADKHIQWHAFRRDFSQSAFSMRVPDDIIAGIMSIDIKSLESYRSATTASDVDRRFNSYLL
ncbi:hypothetical protein SARC_15242, partial [Sphaeroforma arctica JP610]